MVPAALLLPISSAPHPNLFCATVNADKGDMMLFNWETKFHGRCLVSSSAGVGNVSVIIAWGTKIDGYSVEYRIANLDSDDERQRLDRATRLAMGHFERISSHQTGLINLAIDSTSRSFAGPIPEPVH